MLKIGEYIQLPRCLCDSCGKNKPNKKIYAELDGEYQVGIRICDDCWEEFKDTKLKKGQS